MGARITFLCHGRSTARPSAFPGNEDLAEGEAVRIAGLGPSLAGIDLCLASPARAAQQTALALGLTAHVDAALADLDLGEWRAKTIRDIEGSSPEALCTWLEEPDYCRHGGESRTDLAARLSSWLDAKLESHTHTLAVTHPAVMQMALVHVMAAPIAAFRHVDVGPLCRLVLGSDGRRWSLRSFG